MTATPSLLSVFASAGPHVLAFDLARYLLAALPMAGLVWLLMRTDWRSRRIQARRPATADYRRELLASLRTVLVFASVGTFTVWAVRGGWIALGTAMPTPLQFVGHLLLMLVAHDAYFYWTHRALHHRRLFGWCHRLHHRSVAPTPFAAYAFDLPEAFVQAVFMPLWLALVTVPEGVAFVFLTIMILRNVMGHAGLELHTRGWVDHPLLRHINTTLHHDLHHSGAYARNFGLYFTWWDRLMGTEHPDYARLYREVTARPAAADVPALSGRLVIGAAAGLLLIAALLAVVAHPAHAGAAAVEDLWVTPGYAARVRIEPCAANPAERCGRIEWLWEAVDASDRPVRDSHNPDRALRARPVAGLMILQGFRPGTAEWRGGRIYNPEDGRSYDATLRLRGADLLEVRGCVAFLCQSQLWRRASSMP